MSTPETTPTAPHPAERRDRPSPLAVVGSQIDQDEELFGRAIDLR